MKTRLVETEYGTWEIPDDTLDRAEARRDPRYCAEAEMLQHAIDGNIYAAQQVLQYLGSSLTDLRHIMQATLHDSQDPRAWHCLLAYLAWQTWGDWQQMGDWSLYHSSRPPVMRPEAPIGDIEPVIVETFVIDESPAETESKQAVLVEALDGPSDIRKVAAYILGLRGDGRALPVLDELINNQAKRGKSLAWQLRAVEALAALGDPGGAPVLARALASGRGALHQAASKALREMGDIAVPVLLKSLGHPNSHVRWHAARALGQIGDPRGANILAQGLLDENQAVRWATASVLAGLDAAAIPAVLYVLARNPLSEPLRQAIYHALHAMTTPHTQNYLRPLLEALKGPAAGVEAPAIAGRMLAEWHTS